MVFGLTPVTKSQSHSCSSTTIKGGLNCGSQTTCCYTSGSKTSGTKCEWSCYNFIRGIDTTLYIAVEIQAVA